MPAFGTTLKDRMSPTCYLYQGRKCCVEGVIRGRIRGIAPRPTSGPCRATQWRRGGSREDSERGFAGGVGVQLIAPNGVRTTVYTDAQGIRISEMQTGDYVLRVPTPLLFKPTSSIPFILMARPSSMTLSSRKFRTATHCRLLLRSSVSSAAPNCSGTCPARPTRRRRCKRIAPLPLLEPDFRNRYDEHSWGLIVDRMTQYSGTSLVIRIKGTTTTGGGANSVTRRDGTSPEDVQTLVKFLTRVRGPNAQDEPDARVPEAARRRHACRGHRVRIAPSAAGAARCAGDSKGNIWWTSHKTDLVGKLDPKTGIVTEYTIPLTPKGMPGTHAVRLDKTTSVVFGKLEPQSQPARSRHRQNHTGENRGCRASERAGLRQLFPDS